MRITRITAVPVRIEVVPRMVIVSSLGRHASSRYLVVRVETDEGMEGAGEVNAMPRWSGETAAGAKVFIDTILSPMLLGADPCDLENAAARIGDAAPGNWFAKAGVEMALWDLLGKQESKPVYELLGGACHAKALKSRVSIAAVGPEEAARHAADRVAEGFENIKVKIGGDVRASVERVRAVREAIGPRPRLSVDGNGGFNAPDAIQAIRAMERDDLVLAEQPTPRGDISGLAEVRRHIGVPLMADESVFDLDQAREIIARDAADILSIYPGKNGGLSVSRAIARLAADHGLACAIGSNLEWDLATAAMAHLAVSTPAVCGEKYSGDLVGPLYHLDRIARNPVRIERGTTFVPEGPGLGVCVDWEKVERLSCNV
ncbi:MAG: muconate cycloisomerase [Planctomycetes bacterium]|nr:muconate cycloisomerase [Planctomycetota bacterium]